MLRVFIRTTLGPSLAQDSRQSAQDLTAVHSFYLFLLESALEHEVPVPPTIAHDPEVLQRFVLLLDLAVTPQMIRDGLKGEEPRGSAEALLRFFASKPRRRREDRDKVDIIATALYRWFLPEEHGEDSNEAVAERTEKFERELQRIYQTLPIAEAASEHKQLVREFQFFRDEVNDFRHFDELIDSAVIQKVRDLKQTLDASFLHPYVLSTLASYNAFFGSKFDSLFKRAAKEVKNFAAKVQQDGGSIMSRVDGDVTVKHLTEVKESEVLNAEYGSAQESFRKISMFKKAVDTRTRSGSRPMAPGQEHHAPAISTGRSPGHAPAPALAASVPWVEQVPSAINPAVEQGKLRTMEDSIRNFVLAADPKAANIVPLRNGNLVLSGAEVDAFRTDYGGEKSFRADYAASLRTIMALQGRFLAEIFEFKARQGSAYLWKPHADALTWLVTAAQKVEQQCGEILKVADQRGLAEKAATLNASVQKLKTHIQMAAKALQGNVG